MHATLHDVRCICSSCPLRHSHGLLHDSYHISPIPQSALLLYSPSLLSTEHRQMRATNTHGLCSTPLARTCTYVYFYPTARPRFGRSPAWLRGRVSHRICSMLINSLCSSIVHAWRVLEHSRVWLLIGYSKYETTLYIWARSRHVALRPTIGLAHWYRQPRSRSRLSLGRDGTGTQIPDSGRPQIDGANNVMKFMYFNIASKTASRALNTHQKHMPYSTMRKL